MTFPKFLIFLFCLSSALQGSSQTKKTMDIEVFKIWQKINQTVVSNDGNWIAYVIAPIEGNSTLVLYNTKTDISNQIPRGEQPAFSHDSKVFVYKIIPPIDTIKALKRKKTKEEALPKDSLIVLNLQKNTSLGFSNIKNFQMPRKWSGFVVMTLEPKEKKDSLATKLKLKKESADNGFKCLIYNTNLNIIDTIHYIKEFSLAEKWPKMIYTAFTPDSFSTPFAAVKMFEPTFQNIPLLQAKGQFKFPFINEMGDKLGFMYTKDTTAFPTKNFEIQVFDGLLGQKLLTIDSSRIAAPKGWRLAESQKPYFSTKSKRLIFGSAPIPIVQDTSLLPEEIVQVEVWTTLDPQIYPQQKVRLDEQKKLNILHCYDFDSKSIQKLDAQLYQSQQISFEGDGTYALIQDTRPYAVEASWLGNSRRDLYSQNLTKPTKSLIKKGLFGETALSPKGLFAYWYNYEDTTWNSYNLATNIQVQWTKPSNTSFHDLENDVPSPPGPQGIVGWSADDQFVFLYDHWDIWKIDPTMKQSPLKLTEGSSSNIRYRRIKLDTDEKSLPLEEDWLLHATQLDTYTTGLAWLDPSKAKFSWIDSGKFAISPRVIKGKNSNNLVFSKETFDSSPDLYFKAKNNPLKKVSNINPQQSEYSWGTMESVQWINFTGKPNKGLLVKPDHFDPKKKYPLIVNFYEKSTDAIHAYRPPEPLRSQISYSYYASRGYVIFNPDIHYDTGTPGDDAYDAIMSGVQYLLNQGFIDEKNIGIQGHSWGGYQTAYLLTKTNLFKAAESGAPVFNMFSAYGGIRWESGLSRMFQYEHQQSRIGQTPWEAPFKYFDNSPLFKADRITTPVLILHNDKDGAVPWYQGIEMYTALRRLGKKAWLLNYNEEPHWPVKLQNRIDFQIRMSQFFDHYLQQKPMPTWMRDGVPATEKGINQGYEFIKE